MVTIISEADTKSFNGVGRIIGEESDISNCLGSNKDGKKCISFTTKNPNGKKCISITSHIVSKAGMPECEDDVTPVDCDEFPYPTLEMVDSGFGEVVLAPNGYPYVYTNGVSKIRILNYSGANNYYYPAGGSLDNDVVSWTAKMPIGGSTWAMTISISAISPDECLKEAKFWVVPSDIPDLRVEFTLPSDADELETIEFDIENYDESLTYSITVSNGTITQDAEHISWTFPDLNHMGVITESITISASDNIRTVDTTKEIDVHYYKVFDHYDVQVEAYLAGAYREDAGDQFRYQAPRFKIAVYLYFEDGSRVYYDKYYTNYANLTPEQIETTSYLDMPVDSFCYNQYIHVNAVKDDEYWGMLSFANATTISDLDNELSIRGYRIHERASYDYGGQTRWLQSSTTNNINTDANTWSIFLQGILTELNGGRPIPE